MKVTETVILLKVNHISGFKRITSIPIILHNTLKYQIYSCFRNLRVFYAYKQNHNVLDDLRYESVKVINRWYFKIGFYKLYLSQNLFIVLVPYLMREYSGYSGDSYSMYTKFNKIYNVEKDEDYAVPT